MLPPVFGKKEGDVGRLVLWLFPLLPFPFSLLICCCKALIGESQRRPQGFGDKSVSSSADYDSSFEKQLLACVGLCQRLNTNHDMCMWPERPIISWVLSDSFIRRLEMSSSNLLPNGNSVQETNLGEVWKV